MTEDVVVERWAEWSEELCSRWSEERGVSVTVQHDEALARTERQMFRLGVGTPEPATLRGFLFAIDFVSGSDIHPGTKHELIRKLKIQAGLIAETIRNRTDNAVFAEMVGALAQSSRPSSEPLAEDDSWGWTGTFSCNSNGKVWRPGPGPRRYLHGNSRFLDAVVAKVLEVSPRGGRFEVSVDGVFMARDLRQVA